MSKVDREPSGQDAAFKPKTAKIKQFPMCGKIVDSGQHFFGRSL
jgi:hypothetical protein